MVNSSDWTREHPAPGLLRVVRDTGRSGLVRRRAAFGGHVRAQEISVDSGFETGNNQLTLEAAMATMRQAESELKRQDRKLSGIGATEDQMDSRDTIPQRIDRKGSKVEDLAGTGEHDSSGG